MRKNKGCDHCRGGGVRFRSYLLVSMVLGMVVFLFGCSSKSGKVERPEGFNQGNVTIDKGKDSGAEKSMNTENTENTESAVRPNRSRSTAGNTVDSKTMENMESTVAKNTDVKKGPKSFKDLPKENSQANSFAADDEDLYAPILNRVYQVIETKFQNAKPQAGEMGIWEEITDDKDDRHDNHLEEFGYLVWDVTGDGVQELIIAEIDDWVMNGPVGDRVYAIYTLENKTPVLLLESGSKNEVYFSNRSTFYEISSLNILNPYFGEFSLKGDGKQRIWHDYYFVTRDAKTATVMVGHNQSGKMDDPQTRMFEYHSDLVEDLMERMEDGKWEVRLTPLTSYIPNDTKEIKIQFIAPADLAALQGNYEYYAVSNTQNTITILFKARTALKNVRLLAIDSQWNEKTNQLDAKSTVIYQAKEFAPGYPLVFETQLMGHFPEYGIAYETEGGVQKCFYISESGRDGSLSLQEF